MAEASGAAAEERGEKKRPDEPFLIVHGCPVHFQQDWHVGIGGGLWPTGSALARYLGTGHALGNLRRVFLAPGGGGGGGGSPPGSILELGGGNGFLAACLAAALARADCPVGAVEHFAITDTREHLDLIRQVVSANAHAFPAIKNVTVAEHVWGQFDDQGEDPTDSSFEQSVRTGRRKFDLIVGSDLAYREDLYDPLIASLRRFSHDSTVALIGVTAADTKPDFFDRLDAAGFAYERLADHLLDPEFRGTEFGIFVIQRKKEVSLTRGSLQKIA